MRRQKVKANEEGRERAGKKQGGWSPYEDLPTQDHDKITLQDPPRKDHIAFVLAPVPC